MQRIAQRQQEQPVRRVVMRRIVERGDRRVGATERAQRLAELERGVGVSGISCPCRLEARDRRLERAGRDLGAAERRQGDRVVRQLADHRREHAARRRGVAGGEQRLAEP